MVNMLKAEWLKEKRTANRKIWSIVPFIFICFSFLMSLMMGKSPAGKSYFITAAYNWYPLTVLPVVISLLSCNILSKEKKNHNEEFYRSLGVSAADTKLSKIVMVVFDFAVILVVSFILIWIIGKGFLHETVDYSKVMLATGYLFLGNLPLIPISVMLYPFIKQLGVLVLNFFLSVASAVIAINAWWLLFPWSYGIRMMAPTLGIHPNGTFLEKGSYLLNTEAIPLGSTAGIIVFLLLSGADYFILKRGEKNG